MNEIVNWMQQLPEPDRLALSTRYALLKALLEATHMRAEEIQPEHLLLGLIKQNDARIVRMSGALGLDLVAINGYLEPPGRFVGPMWSQSSFFKERPDLEQSALIKRSWRIAEEQYRDGELLKARVIDYSKGGLYVDVSGIRGFVPLTQILNLTREDIAFGDDNRETMVKLQRMIGREIDLKIVEISPERNRLILSERLAFQEWRLRHREELLNGLKPGEIRRGVVSNIANFGIFVDLGGAEGLVHVSQLAWSTVSHPSELFKVGQEVEVQVLSVDKEKKKIALSIKRANESGEIKHVDDGQLSSYEETLKAEESTISSHVEEGSQSPPFSQESLECLHWAISFANHLRSALAFPDHLLLSILLQKRIQSFLAPLLPSPEALLAYFTDEKMPYDINLTSSQADICPACNKSTLPGWKHCVYCGASLARVCPKCGAPYPEIEGARFCFECGELLEE